MSSAKNLIVDAAVFNRNALEGHFHNYTHYVDNHTAWLMRQKLKKLRSIFSLLNPHIIIGKKLKNAFSLVFDSLGNYRDAQQMFIYVENHLLHESFDNFILQMLQKEIGESHKNLTELLKSSVPSELIKGLDKYILKIRKRVPSKCAEKLEHNYIKRRQKKINILIKKKEHNLEKENLHKCRIMLKQVINIMKITGNKFNYKSITLKLKDLEHIDKELGIWHDSDVILTHFKTLHNIYNEPKQQEQYHAFIRCIEDEERKLYQRALDAVGLLG